MTLKGRVDVTENAADPGPLVDPAREKAGLIGVFVTVNLFGFVMLRQHEEENLSYIIHAILRRL